MLIARSMDDRVFLVTGASDGIGKHTALRLAETGATVLMHGRKTDKLPLAVSEIALKTGNKCVEAYAADLSSLSQVRALSEDIHRRYRRLDVLVNNAGVFMSTRTETEDGFEMTFAVNVLAPFLLTSLLMDLLRAGDSSRVVHVSSALHRESSTPIRADHDEMNSNNNNNNNNINKPSDWSHNRGQQAYTHSKLCEVMFTYKMAKVLGKTVSVNCLHPGRVDTNLLKQAWGGKKTGSSLDEADLVFKAATDPALDGVTGRYFEDSLDSASSDVSYDEEKQNKLWDFLVNATGAKY